MDTTEEEEEIVIVKDKAELENLKKDDTIFTYPRAKFTGFGDYGDLDINDRVNELMKQAKKTKELANMDSYLLWLCVVEYILVEEKGLNFNTDEKAKEWYDNFMKERDKREYVTVQLVDENNNPLEVK